MNSETNCRSYQPAFIYTCLLSVTQIADFTLT